MPTTKPKFRVGDRVVDHDGKTGVVIYVYSEPELRDQLVAVRLDGELVPLAYHVADLRKRRAS
jgi:hypothetical protein